MLGWRPLHTDPETDDIHPKAPSGRAELPLQPAKWLLLRTRSDKDSTVGSSALPGQPHSSDGRNTLHVNLNCSYDCPPPRGCPGSFFVNLTQATVIREEAASTEKMPP